MLAATAAHWFDRGAFYVEVERVLPRGGVLGIVEYVRDEAHSPAARSIVDFLNRHGNPRAYARPDYVIELNSLPGFGKIEQVQEPVTLRLSLPEFAGLALSSSHARKVIEDLGYAEADARLQGIGAALTDDGGKVPFGYLFQVFLVIRA